MTHAQRGHTCDLCGRTVYGNGGKVSHGRGHVRRGEAVELVKHYATDPPMSHRMFVRPDDIRVKEHVEHGYQRETFAEKEGL